MPCWSRKTQIQSLRNTPRSPRLYCKSCLRVKLLHQLKMQLFWTILHLLWSRSRISQPLPHLLPLAYHFRNRWALLPFWLRCCKTWCSVRLRLSLSWLIDITTQALGTKRDSCVRILGYCKTSNILRWEGSTCSWTDWCVRKEDEWAFCRHSKFKHDWYSERDQVTLK